MVKFTIEQLRTLMDLKSNIRNMSVIAHVDHGKSTLTETLVAANGIGKVTDGRDDEREKGITIKSTGISLFTSFSEAIPLPAGSQGRDFLINLIDSPGHVDFSSEVTAALRITDGALVLVDCVEGSCVQTETVLRQALRERIRPVLGINKIDRAIMEKQLQPEEIYQSLNTHLEDVNGIISTYADEAFGDCTVHPLKGNVAFSAGKQGWAFTLQTFARIYAQKFKIEESKMLRRLWGDNFYDAETKKWSTSPVSESGKPLARGFCKFIMEPIMQVFNACLGENAMSKLEKLLPSLNVVLKGDEKELQGKELLSNVMKKWLPASEAILEMIILHLPSPVQAQKYRVEVLYTGPLDDETATAIRNCDEKGPLVMYVSKLVPTKDNSRFFAFGRVFSGTVASGTKIRILGPNYEPGKKTDLVTNVSIQRTVVMMGSKAESVDSVPVGNTCALVGIDNYMTKSSTITTNAESYPLVNMKYSVSPVVRVAVQPKDPTDLPKFVESLKRVVKSDPLVQCTVENTGEHIVACAGELHLEIIMKDLRDYMSGAAIVVSPPVVSFKETVTRSSTVNCLAKSPNHHNRLYASAEPLSTDLVAAIEEGKVNVKEDVKQVARVLADEYQWDVSEARKIWAFGPELNNTNAVVDGTKGIMYLNEIKDSVNAAFQWVTREGALADEAMRGVRFNLLDAVLHADAIHRGQGQIIPSARRVFYASQLSAEPRLMEPVYLVDIQCPSHVMSGIYSCLNQRRGVVVEATQKHHDFQVKAHLPVVESFGFCEALRAQTSGQAFPQLIFDHWALMNESPFQEGHTRDLVLSIRKRKGLAADIPALDHFCDKL